MKNRATESGEVPAGRFPAMLKDAGLLPLKATGVSILQVNVGRRCNLSCKHCHLESGPQRTEEMAREVFERCVEVAKNPAIAVIDITGGAPEMNPQLPWFIGEVAALKKRLIVRSNLVILGEDEYSKFIDIYCDNGVEIVGSLPNVHNTQTDRQRGSGVFDREIAVIKQLNERGYGAEGSNLVLDLVHNPVGAFLPASQATLEQEYKRQLLAAYGIRFNKLFTLINNPSGRYLAYLVASGNHDEYMSTLESAFNPVAARNVMCRSTLSVGWDGKLYDCDFNQALGMSVNHGTPNHINQFDMQALASREIVVADHCFACTAGAGSSCQGAVDA